MKTGPVATVYDAMGDRPEMNEPTQGMGPLTAAAMRAMLPVATFYSNAHGECWDEESMFWFARAALRAEGQPKGREPAKALTALRELVACKDLKIEWERLALKIADGDDDPAVFRQWDAIKGDYDHRAPLAWEAARRALADTAVQRPVGEGLLGYSEAERPVEARPETGRP